MAEQPILTVSIRAGVSDGALDEEELGKKVKRIEDKTLYKMAKSGDLVFNMMRAWQGSIGVVRSDGIVSPAYIVATPNNKVYPQFMDYFMKTPQMINTIHRQSYGVMDFRLRLYFVAEISQEITKIITKHSQVDWTNNKTIHDRISQSIDDLFFEYEKTRGLKLSFDVIDKIIENIKTVSLRRF